MYKRPAEDDGPSASQRGRNVVARTENSNGIEEGAGRASRARVGKDVLKPMAKLSYGEVEPTRLHELFHKDSEDNIVEVVIQPDAMSKDNKRVKARQIWGDLVYTSDSDLVAVLMHLGYFSHHLSHPPSSVQQFHCMIRLLAPQQKYTSKARFVKSRAWTSWKDQKDACSFQVERCWLQTKGGNIIELQPCVDELPTPFPTVLPMTSDRQITTRNTGSKGKLHQQQEVSVQFNLCNEPWLKYGLGAIADKGLKPSQWTSSRLVLHEEVLFLETARERFQICYTHTVDGDGAAGRPKDLFSFAKCKAPLPVSLMLKNGVPMPPELIDMLETGLEWEDFKWGLAGLVVRDKEYPLKRLHFMPMTKPSEMAS